MIESVHDIVAEGHYFFEGFDKERKVFVEIGFLLYLINLEMVVIHNIKLL